jgi:hypothetical protein
MNTDQGDPIDLRLFLKVQDEGAVPVTRAELREALEANRTPGSKRRLSSDAHVDLALRYKQGEPATRLGLAFGISSGSVAQVVARVERAAKRLRPKASTSTTAMSARTTDMSATAGPTSTNGKISADEPEQLRRQPPSRLSNGMPEAKRETRRAADATASVECGPFLREVFDAIRPLAGPSHVSKTDLVQVAAALEKIANLMRKRAHQAER